MPQLEPLHLRLKTLRAERGLSQERLVRLLDENFSYEMLKGLEAPPESQKHRYPSIGTLELLARALGIPPEDFPEYRLAMARRLLDERAVGLDQAVANLEGSGLSELLLQQRGAPAIPGETGRLLRGPDPSRVGRRRPDSGQGTGASGNGKR